MCVLADSLINENTAEVEAARHLAAMDVMHHRRFSAPAGSADVRCAYRTAYIMESFHAVKARLLANHPQMVTS